MNLYLSADAGRDPCTEISVSSSLARNETSPAFEGRVMNGLMNRWSKEMKRDTKTGHLAALVWVILALGVAGCGNSRQATTQVFEGREAAAEQLNDEGAGHEGHAGGEHSGEGHDDEEGLLKLSEEEAKAAGVRVEELMPREKAGQIIATANIEPNQTRLAHVQPRMTGRIVRVEANLGDQVSPGQTLATLDSVALNEAGVDYLQAQSELALAQANFERAQNLFADKIIPQKDFLSARAEMEKALATVRAAASKLKLFGVDPAAVEAHDGSLVFPVKSPFSGTVIEKRAVLGDLAEVGEELFTVADLSTLWIEASIYEKDLAKIEKGIPAHVTVTAYPEEIFQGRVTYIGSSMDRETRTVNARVEVANSDGKLKLGMFANAVLDTGAGSGEQALIVPAGALVLMEGQPTIFVAEGGGFEPRTVATGERMQGNVVIQSGVTAGERVVMEGAYTLKALLLKSQIGSGHAH